MLSRLEESILNYFIKHEFEIKVMKHMLKQVNMSESRKKTPDNARLDIGMI